MNEDESAQRRADNDREGEAECFAALAAIELARSIPSSSVSEGAGSAFVFSLESALSPHAKHALETYQIAFTQADTTMTVLELRTAIRRIYGEAVDRELEQHMHARREAVLPKP